MNCKEFLRQMADPALANSEEALSARQAHLSACPACRATWEFTQGLPAAPEPRPEFVAELLHRMEALPLVPVQPLPSRLVYLAQLAAISGLFAGLGILALGQRGLRQLSENQLEVFTGLIVFLFGALALSLYQELANRRQPWLPSGLLLSFATLGYGVFATGLFQWNPHAEEFLKSGVICLSIGTLTALATAFSISRFMQHGHPLRPATARNFLAGLATLSGLVVLQVFCPKQEAAHLLVAHGLVLPLVTWLAQLLGQRLLPVR